MPGSSAIRAYHSNDDTPFPDPRLTRDIYGVLAAVLSQAGEEDTAGGYIKALLRVLEAAKRSEEHGLPMSAFLVYVCGAAGGDSSLALPPAATWRALQIAAKLLDDVQDGDVAVADRSNETGEDMARTDVARVINLSTGFIAVAGLALKGLPPQLELTLHYEFGRAMLGVAGGQHLDLGRRAALSLDEYFQVIGAKSGLCFAVAARAGALCAGADEAALAQWEELGYRVGMIVQMVDDLTDWHDTSGKGDLVRGQWSLPVYYALEVLPGGERAQLLEWLTIPTSTKAQARARDMIASVGAELYVRTEIAIYMNQALAVLADLCCDPIHADDLHKWLSAFHF
ncbi:MAG TPA: polyprenyl synthetase family protein [Chloroflexia bacterium]|nr:polyprenyl synthetase family protein [Chloroflexia bacterium]